MRGDLAALDVGVDHGLGAQKLVDRDRCREGLGEGAALGVLVLLHHVLGTDAHDDGLAHVAALLEGVGLGPGHGDDVLTKGKRDARALLGHRHVDEVHLRGADEAGNKEVAGLLVELGGGIHLLHDAVLHDDDAGTERHGLGLVVRDVDNRGAEAVVQLGDLGAHLDTELGVEVGERLVHEIDLGGADDGAAHGNALALAAGEGGRLAVEELLEVEDAGGLANGLVDGIRVDLAELERERHVVVDGHVRVQRVGLEDHRDVAVLGLNIVDHATVDLEGAGGDVLEAGDHAQRRGLAAARGADEDDELLVGNLKVEILHPLIAVGVLLPYVFECEARHLRNLSPCPANARTR